MKDGYINKSFKRLRIRSSVGHSGNDVCSTFRTKQRKPVLYERKSKSSATPVVVYPIYMYSTLVGVKGRLPLSVVVSTHPLGVHQVRSVGATKIIFGCTRRELDGPQPTSTGSGGIECPLPDSFQRSFLGNNTVSCR